MLEPSPPTKFLVVCVKYFLGGVWFFLKLKKKKKKKKKKTNPEHVPLRSDKFPLIFKGHKFASVAPKQIEILRWQLEEEDFWCITNPDLQNGWEGRDMCSQEAVINHVRGEAEINCCITESSTLSVLSTLLQPVQFDKLFRRYPWAGLWLPWWLSSNKIWTSVFMKGNWMSKWSCVALQ